MIQIILIFFIPGKSFDNSGNLLGENFLGNIDLRTLPERNPYANSPPFVVAANIRKDRTMQTLDIQIQAVTELFSGLVFSSTGNMG